MKNLGFETYKIYRALKCHFNNKNYNFLMYRAKTNNVVETWNDFHCREIFALYSRKLSLKKLKDFFIANFVNNNKYFPNNYETEFDIYLDWLRRVNAIKYNFENDVKKIKKFLEIKNLSFHDLIISKNGKLPIIILLIFKKVINVESFIILDNIFMILNNCEFLSSDVRLLYDKRILVLKKYKLFFKITNLEEYKLILYKILK